MCLPFKDQNPNFPNNKTQAYKSLYTLQRKFLKDDEYFKRYKDFIQEMLDLKYAIKVPKEELIKDKKWYLIHHSVIHPQK